MSNLKPRIKHQIASFRKKKKIDISKLPKLFKNFIFPFLDSKSLLKYRQCNFYCYNMAFNELRERYFYFLKTYRPLYDQRYFILKKIKLSETIAMRKTQIQNITKKLSFLEAGRIKDKEKRIKEGLIENLNVMNQQLDDLIYGIVDYNQIFRFLVFDQVYDPSNQYDIKLLMRSKPDIVNDTALYKNNYWPSINRNKIVSNNTLSLNKNTSGKVNENHSQSRNLNVENYESNQSVQKFDENNVDNYQDYVKYQKQKNDIEIIEDQRNHSNHSNVNEYNDLNANESDDERLIVTTEKKKRKNENSIDEDENENRNGRNTKNYDGIKINNSSLVRKSREISSSQVEEVEIEERNAILIDTNSVNKDKGKISSNTYKDVEVEQIKTSNNPTNIKNASLSKNSKNTTIKIDNKNNKSSKSLSKNDSKVALSNNSNSVNSKTNVKDVKEKDKGKNKRSISPMSRK